MLFHKKEKPAPNLEEIKEIMERPAEEMPTPVHQPKIEAEDAAPLFVKIDKYKEVFASLHELKLFVSGIKQLFVVMHEIETIRSDALNIMRSNIQRMEKSISRIDVELLRPKGVSMAELGVKEIEAGHIEDTLTELQKQLAQLRQDLQGMQAQEGA